MIVTGGSSITTACLVVVVTFDLFKEIVFFIRSEVILSSGLAAKRFTVSKLLEIIETASNSLVAIAVESIQAGPKELLKEVDGKLIPLVYMLMGAQTYLKFVQKRRDYKYIVSAANTAKPMIAISVSDLDKNENLINTPYATYDLRKGLAGELPHNPEDLITKITACSPGEDGKQIWLDALNLFFCKDQKLIDYVQETVGMAAIGKVYQEHMIIAYGGGANGKSTFWNTIFRVLGNYAGKLSAEALTMNCKRNVKPEI